VPQGRVTIITKPKQITVDIKVEHYISLACKSLFYYNPVIAFYSIHLYLVAVMPKVSNKTLEKFRNS